MNLKTPDAQQNAIQTNHQFVNDQWTNDMYKNCCTRGINELSVSSSVVSWPLDEGNEKKVFFPHQTNTYRAHI